MIATAAETIAETATGSRRSAISRARHRRFISTHYWSQNLSQLRDKTLMTNNAIVSPFVSCSSAYVKKIRFDPKLKNLLVYDANIMAKDLQKHFVNLSRRVLASYAVLEFGFDH